MQSKLLRFLFLAVTLFSAVVTSNARNKNLFFFFI